MLKRLSPDVLSEQIDGLLGRIDDQVVARAEAHLEEWRRRSDVVTNQYWRDIFNAFAILQERAMRHDPMPVIDPNTGQVYGLVRVPQSGGYHTFLLPGQRSITLLKAPYGLTEGPRRMALAASREQAQAIRSFMLEAHDA